MISKLTILALAWNALVFAAKEPPKLPAPGQDLTYEETPGHPEPAVDVIARHRKNTVCRDQLTKALKVYDGAKKKWLTEISKRSAAAVINQAEEDMRRAREPMLVKVEQCGPCVTREPKQIVLRKQIWWVADGSCQLESDDAGLKLAYDKVTASLLHLPEYAKHAIDPNKADPN